MVRRTLYRKRVMRPVRRRSFRKIRRPIVRKRMPMRRLGFRRR